MILGLLSLRVFFLLRNNSPTRKHGGFSGLTNIDFERFLGPHSSTRSICTCSIFSLNFDCIPSHFWGHCATTLFILHSISKSLSITVCWTLQCWTLQCCFTNFKIGWKKLQHLSLDFKHRGHYSEYTVSWWRKLAFEFRFQRQRALLSWRT